MNCDYVEPLEFASLRKEGKVVPIDVREPEEWQVGNLGGLHIPLASLGERLEELDPDQPYVLICRSGKRSEVAWLFLKQKGFRSVKVLKGGLLAWKEWMKDSLEIL